MPPQLSGEGSLGTEVISSQAGIVDLQQDAGVVHGGREDLGRWGRVRSLGAGGSAQTRVLRWAFLPGTQNGAPFFRRAPFPPSLSPFLCVIVDKIHASKSLMR